MTYLLDVNAIVALAVLNHEFHQRVARWVQSSRPQLATCSITEIGFVRVLSQAPSLRAHGSSGADTTAANEACLRISSEVHFRFQRCVRSADVGQVAQAGHGRTFEPTGCSEQCNSGNVGRKHSGFIRNSEIGSQIDRPWCQVEQSSDL